MIRAVTYVRQSHKSETDSQASPKMQRETGVAYINSQANWRHAGHYEDVGLSGYDPNVFRPDFERLMEDARAKKFDVVVIYMLSRLTRQGAAEALKIQQELANHGVALVSTQEPFINTSDDNPFGVAFFALIAGLAHQESKNKSKFIRDAFAELKAKGSHTSGPVPFGFEAEQIQVDKLTIRKLKPQAPGKPAGDAVRRMIELAEGGTVPNAIATKLTEDRVLTPLEMLPPEKAEELRAASRKRRKVQDDGAPAEWSSTVVLRILRDPRLAGFAIGPVDPKTKRRTILRGDEGDPVRPHEGFMEPAAWYALQKVLDGRTPKRKNRAGQLSLLGSWGIANCGRCNSGMTNAYSTKTYTCNLRRSVGSAPRHTLRIGMGALDNAVASQVWARLSALDPADEDDELLLVAAAERFALQAADPAASEELAEQEAQLEHVQQSLAELYEDRDAGLYTGPTGRRSFADTVRKYQAHETRCMEHIARLKESTVSSTQLPLNDWVTDESGDPFASGSVWSRWSVDERRSFIALFVDRVVVHPAEGRGYAAARALDDRVTVEWARPKVPDDEEVDVK
ncbi:recombinase family protein [Streptomyces caniferus]|uniref:recombinase family protein n=1 Tax=Streptomyces caniferus TaxID=285557 RepID=UPI002E2D4329|nr:recombinase family protein [Streptomyces caniferus]